MPLIPPPPEPRKKRTVNVRLEEGIFENLKRYIVFSGRGDLSYYVNNSLSHVFDNDADFQSWLRTHPTPIDEPNKKKRHSKPSRHTSMAAPVDPPPQTLDPVIAAKTTSKTQEDLANAAL